MAVIYSKLPSSSNVLLWLSCFTLARSPTTLILKKGEWGRWGDTKACHSVLRPLLMADWLFHFFSIIFCSTPLSLFCCSLFFPIFYLLPREIEIEMTLPVWSLFRTGPEVDAWPRESALNLNHWLFTPPPPPPPEHICVFDTMLLPSKATIQLSGLSYHKWKVIFINLSLKR